MENLRAVQLAAGSAVETLAVVKANGYGHDAALVAQVLVAGGARWLGVSDAEEGARVRAAVGVETRILVMCGMEAADAPAMVAHGLTPVIWTVDHLTALEAAAAEAGRTVRAHVEIDTGMSRQGVPAGVDLSNLLERLKASRWVSCEGVMSHLAASEVAGSVVTAAQRRRFAAALELATAVGVRPGPVRPFYVHLGNSSAVDEGSTGPWMREMAARMGATAMVRTGLAVYGYCLEVEAGEGILAKRLRPALTWKTRVIGLREVAAGATVGYGATFTAPAPMRLALLPVGYADGLRREASSGIGNGWVRIAGKHAAVVGRVSMNLTLVDVTGLPKIAMGQEVVLLGEGVSAADHAAWCGTIPYEILCGLRGHVHLV